MNGEDRLEAIAFPDRDPSLAALIRRLSEPETGRPADNLVSNEDSYPRVASEIARRAPRDSVHLGVGPDQNFTFVAHARPRLALVVDFRRRNLRLHLLHKALTALSPDRASYLRRLTAREPARPVGADAGAAEVVAAFSHPNMKPELLARTAAEVRDVLRPLGILADDEWADLAGIQAKLAGPGLDARFLALRMYPTVARLIATTDRSGGPAHWLAAERTYAAVRERQVSDRIVPVTADLAGAKGLPAVAAWLRERGLRVGTVYASDVEFFLMRNKTFDRFVANLAALPRAEGGILIRTATREIESPERVAGDSSTTVVRPLDRFLADAARGAFRSHDDLFKPS